MSVICFLLGFGLSYSISVQVLYRSCFNSDGGKIKNDRLSNAIIGFIPVGSIRVTEAYLHFKYEYLYLTFMKFKRNYREIRYLLLHFFDVCLIFILEINKPVLW